ncbi:MAG: hypothetical protein CMM93_00370 [Rickettsiales bacterium]|nr:hypothetical protein [Rickettsiales bacterium]
MGAQFVTSLRLKDLKAKFEAIQPKIDELRTELAVAEDAKTGQVQQAFISLPVGTSDQIGLCGDGQNIDVSWHTVMASEARSFLKGVAEENWHALIIDDGKCDKVWLLWPIGAEGNQVDWRAVRR